MGNYHGRVKERRILKQKGGLKRPAKLSVFPGTFSVKREKGVPLK